MALNLLLLRGSTRSVVIPDEKHDAERLRSIATIHKRLQDAIDEGRRLRRSLELVSVELERSSSEGPERRKDRRD